MPFGRLGLRAVGLKGLQWTILETATAASSWRTTALVVLTVGLIVAVTAALVLPYSPVRGGGAHPSPTSNSTGTATATDRGLGIELVLSVTPSQGPRATSFEVNATVWNTLSRPNNVTGVGDYHGVQVNPLCNTGPVTFEVLRGYYTLANFTAGDVLGIHGVQNMMCTVPTSALSYYVFQPNSDRFAGPSPQVQMTGAQSGAAAGAVTSRAATAGMSLVNVYSSGFANPEPFPAGAYTVVAADNWGQLAAAHFTVTG